MVSRVIIVGTGGNCLDILDTLIDINDARHAQVYECMGFLDDDESKWNKGICGVRVLGPLVTASQYTDCAFIFGIGSASNFWKRRDILAKMGLPPERFETIIHPTASVSRTAHVGRGVVIFQNATITFNAHLGDYVYVLPNNIISHDAFIGDYTCLAGGVCVSGGVRVGQSCYLGTNSAIKENIRIGNGSLIGMGSVVLSNVPENSVVVGNPARLVRHVRAEQAGGMA